jgi:hypothetical protein
MIRNAPRAAAATTINVTRTNGTSRGVSSATRRKGSRSASCPGKLLLAAFLLLPLLVVAWFLKRLGTRRPPQIATPDKVVAPPLSSPPTRLAYAVTITDCERGDGQSVPFPITEGAAILAHSIRQQTTEPYTLYAISHPSAVDCASTLPPFGYQVLLQEFPVAVSEIRGDFLRQNIEKNGCCGERELLKLVAFDLIQHEIVVLLDLDVVLLQPLAPLLNAWRGHADMAPHLQWPTAASAANITGKMSVSMPADPTQVALLYTVDYAMVSPRRQYKPFQGGLLLLRPNRDIYQEFLNVVRLGDFRDNGGWGGVTGKFWGAMTIQGILPYFFLALHPGRAAELNRCVYDNMASHVRTADTNICYTQESNCQDCRETPVSDIVAFHLTVCQKPWLCMRHLGADATSKLCRQFHHAWFTVRSQLEESWGRSAYGPGTFDREHFFGYCSRHGKLGYQLIAKPYGPPLANISSSRHLKSRP